MDAPAVLIAAASHLEFMTFKGHAWTSLRAKDDSCFDEERAMSDGSQRNTELRCGI
jgi:hypothetical protein